MKKFTLLAALLILALGALVLPAAAQEQDLTTLAQYLPAEAPLYAAFSIGDDTIASLDALGAKFASALSPNGQMEETLQEALDRVAADLAPDGTFAATVRSWLGDSAAVGMYELSAQTMQNPVPPITIAIAITDQQKAEAFFATLPDAEERYTAKVEDGYTLYTPNSTGSSDPYWIFRSDVLLITGDEALAESGGSPRASALNASDGFTTALDMLPADVYAGLLYLDTPALFNFGMAMMPTRGMPADSQAAMDMVTSMMAALKPQAIGLTLLDNRSLALDVASPLDAAALGAMSMAQTYHPVDAAFAEHIPAGIPLVVHSTDLYGSYTMGIESLRSMAQMMPEDADMRPQDIETALWGLGFLVRGLTGLEPEAALGWATGDYALALDFAPAFTDAADLSSQPESLPFDFGLVVAATDEAQAQAVFDGLNRSLMGLPAEEVTVAQETIGDDVPALTFSITTRDLEEPIEILAAVGDGVFAIGTRRMVTAAVAPQNGGLSADATFADASEYLLDDANSIFYLSGVDLQPLARLMTASGNPMGVRQSGKQVQAVLDLLSSATISMAVLPDNNGSVARFVWTMPE